MYPYYCVSHMLAPHTDTGQFIKKPFIKFICHSSSYILFLMLLAMASQRIEYLIVEILAHLLEDGDLQQLVTEWERTERGSLPNYVETVIILWQVLLAHTNIIYPQEALMGEINLPHIICGAMLRATQTNHTNTQMRKT